MKTQTTLFKISFISILNSYFMKSNFLYFLMALLLFSCKNQEEKKEVRISNNDRIKNLVKIDLIEDVMQHKEKYTHNFEHPDFKKIMGSIKEEDNQVLYIYEFE